MYTRIGSECTEAVVPEAASENRFVVGGGDEVVLSELEALVEVLAEEALGEIVARERRRDNGVHRERQVLHEVRRSLLR